MAQNALIIYTFLLLSIPSLLTYTLGSMKIVKIIGIPIGDADVRGI